MLAAISSAPALSLVIVNAQRRMALRL